MSIDSVFVHKMWNDHELAKMVNGGVPFPMLSDAGGKVGTAFGVYDDEAGVEMRGRFIIDPEGVVQGYEVLTPPVGRNVSETIRSPARSPSSPVRIWLERSGRSGRPAWRPIESI